MAASAFEGSLAELATGLRSDVLDVTAMIEAACDAIDLVNPSLLALLPEPARRARLLDEAAALEHRFPAPAERPPLYGVPMAVKDVIRVDGFPTQAGSALPPELFEGPEATVVSRLRVAGALVLGKTVTTEFAYFEPAATRNPRAPGHTPGGSSSGSAAAVAAGLAPLALGTQTVGSVIRPAAFCGVAAFKPSYGRAPSAGVVYYAPSIDTVGWFASDAAGLIEAARVLLDDWREPVRVPTRALRVAVPQGPYLEHVEPAALEAFSNTLETLAAAGVEVYRVPALTDIAGIVERHRWLTTFEFAAQHESWYRDYGALYRPRSSLLVEEGRALTVQQHAAGVASAAALRDELSLLAASGLDGWVSPSAPGPAPAGLNSTGDPIMNAPWTHAGLPVVTLPAGDVQGLPVGLQIAGRHGDDEALLAVALALEASLEGRLDGRFRAAAPPA
jgi:Asp-tRNA(Asn)/Glu-tRNA(Gln) amidotransferase A subunit family amidase